MKRLYFFFAKNNIYDTMDKKVEGEIYENWCRYRWCFK